MSKKRKKELPPLALETVQAGFPSPAAQYIENALDLNELLVPYPSRYIFCSSFRGINGWSGNIAGRYTDCRSYS